MTHVCVWTPVWPTGAASPADLASHLLDIAPRVAVEPGRVWLDGRGLDAPGAARTALRRLRRLGIAEARAGVADAAITASVAAEWTDDIPAHAAERHARVTLVAPGMDRAFLAPLPLAVLHPQPPLAGWLQDTGLGTCADLAALPREAVEVRFGPAGVALWRLARADDPRLLFPPPARPLPEAGLEWLDYELKDAGRLLFVVNRLMATVTGALAEAGERATVLRLTLTFSGRPAVPAGDSPGLIALRSTRPTASRATWMRLARDAFERTVLPDAVTGIRLAVEAVAGGVERQGDLFDRGFATGVATEEAVTRVVDAGYAALVAPERWHHPLPERRTRWLVREPAAACAEHPSPVAGAGGPRLTLQLLPAPRAIRVVTAPRRDHQVPVRFRDDDGWQAVQVAAGPDRVSGGQWEGEAAWARDYFRCVTATGRLVWLFHDARSRAWYLHGWWD